MPSFLPFPMTERHFPPLRLHWNCLNDPNSRPTTWIFLEAQWLHRAFYPFPAQQDWFLVPFDKSTCNINCNAYRAFEQRDLHQTQLRRFNYNLVIDRSQACAGVFCGTDSLPWVTARRLEQRSLPNCRLLLAAVVPARFSRSWQFLSLGSHQPKAASHTWRPQHLFVLKEKLFFFFMTRNLLPQKYCWFSIFPWINPESTPPNKKRTKYHHLACCVVFPISPPTGLLASCMLFPCTFSSASWWCSDHWRTGEFPVQQHCKNRQAQ